MIPTNIDLPIIPVIPQIQRAFQNNHNAVLQAPPGAGKTTLVPLALINEASMKGQKIIMLEPRRLAARAAAMRMAYMINERVGETVGYRVRMDSKVGPQTCIEVVTEGILTRFLQEDPSLEGVGLIIFDEFHERSIHAELGLALTLESQSVLLPGDQSFEFPIDPFSKTCLLKGVDQLGYIMSFDEDIAAYEQQNDTAIIS